MEQAAVVSTIVKKRPLWRRGWFLAAVASCVILVAVVGVGSVLFAYPLKIEGTGMAPTLNDGDRIFVQRAFRKIERGDIVVFHFPKDTTKSFMQRVIALPGDTISINYEGAVYINGSLTTEPYLAEERFRFPRTLPETTIGTNEYFVMGDNRDASNDSRSWGTVPRKLIYGKFVYRYWPSF